MSNASLTRITKNLEEYDYENNRKKMKQQKKDRKRKKGLERKNILRETI